MDSLLQIQDNLTSKYHSIDVIKYDIEYKKVWGSSITNMEGSTRAVLLGVFPVINASTAPLYQKEAKLVGNLLNQGSMYIKFYDTISGLTLEQLYVSSDISINMIRKAGKWYEEVEFTLTPIDIQAVS